jgi:hypothetical protein
MSSASQQRARWKTLGKHWTPFVAVPVTDRLRASTPYLRHVHSIFQNSRYTVHLFACASPLGGVMQCDVRRMVEGLEIPYADLQRVKCELFSPHAVALEVYPPEAIEYHTKRNIRFLWVMPMNYELHFGLHLPTAFGGQP